MDVNGEYRLNVSREVAWTALNDPEVLRRCIPGCVELTRESDSEYTANIVAAIGPVKAKFRTEMQLTDLDPPNGYTLVGNGKGGAAGFGKGQAVVRLVETDGLTVLHYRADFNVGGRLAQVGSRLVVGATRKLADDFFGSLSAEIDPGASRESEAAAAPEPDSKPSPTARRGLWIALLAAAIAALATWLIVR